MADFGKTAKGLARNPLGIIALFLVLAHAFASLVVGFSDQLQPSERWPIIWFIVLYPVLVLVLFGWLVSRHHTKLYAPSDFENDATFAELAQREAAAALARAQKQKGGASASVAAEGAAGPRVGLQRYVANVAPAAVVRRANGKRILWVDDRPQNNVHERAAFEALGLDVELATSTDDALKVAAARAYDVIVSDMGRGAEARAGYDLLEKLRARGDRTPFVIYAGSRDAEHVREALARGAAGTTNRPDELFDLVLRALDAHDG